MTFIELSSSSSHCRLVDETVAAATQGSRGLTHLRSRSVIEVLLLFLLTSSVTDVHSLKPADGASGNPNTSLTEEAAESGATDFQDFRGGHWQNYDVKSLITSSNVFVDDLLTSPGQTSRRQMNAVNYVTASTQATDFYWDRESGLRIHVGLNNVRLVPEYEDVDHSGKDDNKYTFSNPNNDEDKEEFKKAIATFCRYPVPDKYVVTLEISRDRTTAVRRRIVTPTVSSCEGKNRTLPSCLKQPSSNKSTILRQVNEPCFKLGTFPDNLASAANSFVCTHETAMLHRLFNQSRAATTVRRQRLIKFPSKECRSALGRCDQCLQSAAASTSGHAMSPCNAAVVSDSTRAKSSATTSRRWSCCLVDCYQTADCKLALSSQCSDVPIECAMGDAYRYTIQPVFNNVTAGLRCHIRHRPTEVLYNLFYYVEILGRNFRSAKVRRTVTSAGLQDESSSPSRRRSSTFSSRGSFTTAYLTVEHDTGLTLAEEYLLERRGSTSSDAGSKVIGVVKRLPDDNTHGLARSRAAAAGGDGPVGAAVHEISTDAIYATSVTFDRPFTYSTSNWRQSELLMTSASTGRRNSKVKDEKNVDEQSDDSTCSEVDVGKFRPVLDDVQLQVAASQTGDAASRSMTNANDMEAQNVEAVVHSRYVSRTSTEFPEPFVYFLESADNSPYIRFSVPRNVSVLRHSFQTVGDESTGSLKDGSLRVSLASESDDGNFQLFISGRTTGCPTYLGLTVIDSSYPLHAPLVNSDLVVFCPPSFNVTIQLSRQQRQHLSKSAADSTSNLDDVTSATFFVRLVEVDGRKHDVHVTSFRSINSSGHVTSSLRLDRPSPGVMTTSYVLPVAVCICGGMAAALVVYIVGREAMTIAASGLGIFHSRKHVNDAEQRFLYTYRFDGGSVDDDDSNYVSWTSNCLTAGCQSRQPPPPLPPPASLNHVTSPTAANVSTVETVESRRRWTASSSASGGARFRRCSRSVGSRFVLVLYIVTSLINCVSFLFTVLFAIVGLLVSDDLQLIVESIDTLQMKRQELAVNLSSEVERRQGDEFSRQMSLAIAQHSTCADVTADVIQLANRKYRLQQKPQSASGMTLPVWSLAADSYDSAVNKFSESYWKQANRMLEFSLNDYRRYVEEAVAVASEAAGDFASAGAGLDGVAPGNWLEFPWEVFNATRRLQAMQQQQQLEYNLLLEGSTALIAHEAVDFWSFMEVNNVQTVATSAKTLRQRYYRQLPQAADWLKVYSKGLPVLPLEMGPCSSSGNLAMSSLEQFNSTRYRSMTVPVTSNLFSNKNSSSSTVGRRRLSYKSILNVDAKRLWFIFFSLDIVLIVRRIVCAYDKYRLLCESITSSHSRTNATLTNGSASVGASMATTTTTTTTGCEQVTKEANKPSNGGPASKTTTTTTLHQCHCKGDMVESRKSNDFFVNSGTATAAMGRDCAHTVCDGVKFFPSSAHGEQASGAESECGRVSVSATRRSRQMRRAGYGLLPSATTTTAAAVLISVVVLTAAVRLTAYAIDVVGSTLSDAESGLSDVIDQWVGKWTIDDVTEHSGRLNGELCQTYLGLQVGALLASEWNVVLQPSYSTTYGCANSESRLACNDPSNSSEDLDSMMSSFLMTCDVKPIEPVSDPFSSFAIPLRDVHINAFRAVTNGANVVIIKTATAILITLITSLTGFIIIFSVESIASKRKTQESENLEQARSTVYDAVDDGLKVLNGGTGIVRLSVGGACVISDLAGRENHDVLSSAETNKILRPNSALNTADSGQNRTLLHGRFMETHV